MTLRSIENDSYPNYSNPRRRKEKPQPEPEKQPEQVSQAQYVSTETPKLHGRKLVQCSENRMFHGSVYPKNFWFIPECFLPGLKHGQLVGVQTLENVVTFHVEQLPRAMLRWIEDLKGGHIQSFGENVVIPPKPTREEMKAQDERERRAGDQ